MERLLGVASHNQVKIEATSRAFEVSAIPLDSDSGINPQPIGRDEILKGVHNRADSARKLQSHGTIIAIENGLIRVEDANGSHWEDVPAVLLDDGSDRLIVFGEGVVIPQIYLDEMLRIGPDKTTIGKVIAQLNPDANIDHQDPHSFLTGGLMSRQQILLATLKKLRELSQSPMQSSSV